MDVQNIINEWETHLWSIIDSYFKNTDNYLCKNQLDSYNRFLEINIPKTIRQFNPIILSYNPITSDNKKTSTNYLYELRITLGGSIKTIDDDKKENVIIPELIDNEIFLNNYVNEKCPEKFSFENNSENEIIFDELISILTEKEQNIIRLAFVERHTYAEIAQMYNVSRQYANTTANRALKKIKEKFFEIS